MKRKETLNEQKQLKSIETLRDYEQYKNACEVMLKRIGNVSMKLNHYNNETIDKIPLVYKGNKGYSKKVLPRLQEIQSCIQSKLKVIVLDKNTIKTNCIFLTLTRKYERTEKGCVESWNFFFKKIPTFQKWLKRNGFNSFVYCLEAHAEGGCHSHFCIILDELIECKKYKYKDDEERFRVENSFLDKFKKEWKYGHITINGVDNSNISNYITKEIGKCNNCENALRRYMKGVYTLNDKKHIYTFYYARNKRNWNASQDLRIKENKKDDLFKYTNNSDISKSKKELKASVYASSGTIKRLEVTPLTETIDSENKEYKPLKDYIYTRRNQKLENRYYDVFNNDKEIEITSAYDVMLLNAKKQKKEHNEILVRIEELKEIRKTLQDNELKLFDDEFKSLLIAIGEYIPTEQEQKDRIINGQARMIANLLLTCA